MFQFLIGRLGTRKPAQCVDGRIRFQFLIGRLGTLLCTEGLPL